ncbi:MULTISPECIES: nuclear transport factor 2 family protein [Kaistia]|uniref:SnoaL-like domain-containing protein n=1 Tax=Kaistia defluvii TaxID=410841 RepID=A0ABV2R398_9HYPH
MPNTVTLSELRKAVEGNDAKALAAFYADDAELRVIDQDHPPSRPLVLKGKPAIRAMLDDVCSRAMKHHLDDGLMEGSHLAFAETCTYPDGVKVYMSAMLELADGKIRRQTNIQAWDH